MRPTALVLALLVLTGCDSDARRPPEAPADPAADPSSPAADTSSPAPDEDVPERPARQEESEAAPATPAVFEIDIGPGEGLSRFEATGAPLTLREAPSGAADVTHVTHEVPEGTPIDYDSTRYQTLRPGTIVARESATVRGRNMGGVRHLTRDAYYRGDFPTEDVPVAAGDTIDSLQDRAEGSCFVRIGGEVVDADLCPTYRGDAFEVVAEPEVALWIRVQPPGDEPSGWLFVSEPAVARAGRSF